MAGIMLMLLTITRMGLDRGQSQEPADEDEHLPQCDLQQNNQAAVVLETYVVVWPLDLSFPGILFRNFQPKNGIDKCLLQVMFVSQGAFQKRGRVATLQVDLCHFIGRIGLPREY